MKYSNGMYFCVKPIVNPEELYECRHLLSIERIPEDCPIEEINKWIVNGTEEWKNCTKEIRVEKQNRFDYVSSTLNDEVTEWLNENIKPSTDKRRIDMPQGWMIYDPYVTEQGTSVTIFFLRRTDAMAFKLRWS